MFSPQPSHLMLTLPLLAVSAISAAVAPVAAAGASEDAVRILTRARVTDMRCSYLSSAERNELQRYTARAEIAAAGNVSPSAAKSAVAAGRAEGSGVACSTDAEADVRETLDAVRQANAAANRVAEATPPAKRKLPAAERTAEMRKELSQRASKGLGFYARIVDAYYLERECRSLPRSDASRFWRQVADLHRETVVVNGKRAVAKVMAKAKGNAAGSSCGRNAQAQIRRGYEAVLSR
jgi:hypothetical protein